MQPTVSLFIIFLTAFFVGEYLFRSLWFGALRGKRGERVVAAISSALLTYVFTGTWRFWFLVPIFVVFYTIFEYIPFQTARTWIRREVFRFLAFVAFAIFFAKLLNTDVSIAFLKLMTVLSGGICAVFFIGDLLGRVMRELSLKNKLEWRGLDNGGLWIGRLERLLIFMLIFMNAAAGIGFLVAAKSILRFSETKADQRIAEYVLIGTLSSFALAIAVSVLTQTGIEFLSALYR